MKEPKPKATENTNPNVAKASKAGAKKTKEKEAGKLNLLLSSRLRVTSKPICPIGWDNCCLLNNTLQWRALNNVGLGIARDLVMHYHDT